jgi:hypothetical protein
MAKSTLALKLSNLVVKPAIADLLNSATLVRESDKTYAEKFGNDKDRGRPTGSTISIPKPPIFSTDENITDLHIQSFSQDYTTLTVKSTKVEIGEDRFQGAIEAPDTYKGLLEETGSGLGGALGSKLETEAFRSLYGNNAVVGQSADVISAIYKGDEIQDSNLSNGTEILIGTPGFNRNLKEGTYQVYNQGKTGTVLDKNYLTDIDGKKVFKSTVLGILSMPAFASDGTYTITLPADPAAVTPGTAESAIFRDENGTQRYQISGQPVANDTAIYTNVQSNNYQVTASADLAALIQVGMVIELPYNLVNAQTKADTGLKATRQVIAKSGSTLVLSEPIFSARWGTKQNVAVNSIAAGAVAVTVVGADTTAHTYDRAYLINKKAFTFFTMKPGKAAGGVENFEVSAEEDSGVKVAGIYGWSFDLEMNVLNLSTLYCGGTLRPEWITQVLIERS